MNFTTTKILCWCCRRW